MDGLIAFLRRCSLPADEQAQMEHHARVLERDSWAWMAGSESESEAALMALAQPYIGWPGWREEWQLSAPA